MTSLKSFIPELSGALQLNPHAIYERQRKLVKVGLLQHVEGRGPGSGVRLSVEAVVVLLISLLATDDLAETEGPTMTLASLKRVREDARIKPQSLGAAQSFKILLIKALTRPDVVQDIHMVSVDRTNLQVSIFLKDGTFVEFGQSRGNWHNRRLWIASHLHGSIIEKVGNQIRALQSNALAAERS
jgi:hypothetical protein